MPVQTLIQILPPTQLAAADALIYAAPAASSVKIGRAVFTNTDTAPHTITINITTGTSSTANIVIAAYTLAPNQAYVSPELAGQVLPANSSLRGFCSAASVVNLVMSGLITQGS